MASIPVLTLVTCLCSITSDSAVARQLDVDLSIDIQIDLSLQHSEEGEHKIDSEQQIRADIGACSSFPCQNEGLCRHENNGFSCWCRPGYSGTMCQITPDWEHDNSDCTYSYEKINDIISECESLDKPVNSGRGLSRLDCIKLSEYIYCLNRAKTCKPYYDRVHSSFEWKQQEDDISSYKKEALEKQNSFCPEAQHYDCYYHDYATYVGTLSKTEHGLDCQRWDTDFPHVKGKQYKPTDFADNSFNHNYCRYTSDEDKPWCYTTDLEHRYQLCNVRKCGGCPHGWTEPGSFHMCYRLFNDKRVTYAEAEVYCAERGGRVATIKSESTQIAADMNQAANPKYVTSMWIALGDSIVEGTYRWSDGSPMSPYTNWANGQPSSQGDDAERKDCVVIMYSRWYNVPCSSLSYPLCQVNPYDCPAGWVFSGLDGQCYRSFTAKENNPEASKTCADLGGRLAMPKTKEANSAAVFAINLIGPPGDAWIGLKDVIPDTFMWDDGQQFTYLDNWQDDLRKGPGQQVCVVLKNDKDGYWDNVKCSDSNYYLCQVDIQAKPAYVECNTEMTPKGLQITCEVRHIDPSAQCVFHTPSSNKDVTKTTLSERNGLVTMVCTILEPMSEAECKAKQQFAYSVNVKTQVNGQERNDLHLETVYTPIHPTNCDVHPQPLPVPCSQGSAMCGRSYVGEMMLPRVLGGQFADRGAWPWTVRLSDSSRPYASPRNCGGAIISESLILTASHSFMLDQRTNLTTWSVTAGVHDINTPDVAEQVVKIQSVMYHDDYDLTFANDIALLVIYPPLKFTPKVQPVCLPPASMGVTEGEECWLAGWGHETKCEDGWQFNTQTKVCYRFFNQFTTFDAAIKNCKNFGARLPESRSADENHILNTLSGGGHAIWLHGSDRIKEGQWIWSDGDSFTWMNWNPGEPNDANANEDCLYQQANSRWVDSSCDNTHINHVCVKSPIGGGCANDKTGKYRLSTLPNGVDALIDIHTDRYTDGGEWIIIQRRVSADVDFYQDWATYQSFFGDLCTNYWLGLDNIHQLCNPNKGATCQLRIDMVLDGLDYHANYSTFSVASASDNYRLHVDGYSGDARDGFDGADKMVFTTKDRDNDHYWHNCANTHHAGWWFTDCGNSSLNGPWIQTTNDGTDKWQAINWSPLTHWKDSLTSVEMKIRKICPNLDNGRKLRHLSSGIEVLSDVDTDDEEWIIIQRRESDSVDFYQDWATYQAFFGDLCTNYWLGLDNIHQLCNPSEGATCELRIDMRLSNGTDYHAHYSTFGVASASDNYRLHVAGVSGDAGDGFAGADGMMFTTKDLDNDHYWHNCANTHHAGWWYTDCGNSNLNGPWIHTTNDGTDKWQAINWSPITHWKDSLSFVEMKVRGPLVRFWENPSKLKQIKIPVINDATCEQADWLGLSFTDKTHKFCAGYVKGSFQEACDEGDGGTPLVCKRGDRWFAQGIASYNEIGCGHDKNPGVYTDVSKYTDWLQKMIASTSTTCNNQPTTTTADQPIVTDEIIG